MKPVMTRVPEERRTNILMDCEMTVIIYLHAVVDKSIKCQIKSIIYINLLHSNYHKTICCLCENGKKEMLLLKYLWNNNAGYIYFVLKYIFLTCVLCPSYLTGLDVYLLKIQINYFSHQSTVMN
jgi:hypothetical protein